MMLMLNRALLQPAVDLDPDASSRSANLALNAVLDAVFYRLGVWGIPLATSIVNIAGDAVAARRCCAAASAGSTWRDDRARSLRIAVASAVLGARRLRRLVRARRRARPLASPAQLVSLGGGARRRRRRLPRRLPAARGARDRRRCSRCATRVPQRR